MFREKEIRPLGFTHRGDFIGEGAESEVRQVVSPQVAAPTGGEAGPWPLRLIFGLREASVKIGGSAFFSSNSENISCVTFLKHKNNRKRGTDTVASC
jgi:hypothetical protein